MIDDLQAFESAQILIERSLEKVDEFEKECKIFAEECTYTVEISRNRNSSGEILKLLFGRRTPPSLRYFASGIINDLRNALDHAFCDAAEIRGCPNLTKVHFPFAKNSDELDGQIKRVCKNVDPALCAYAKAQRPYLGGDDLLYTLNALCNPNKHRRIIRLTLESTGISFTPKLANTICRPGELEIGFLGWNDRRNEMTVARASGGFILPNAKSYLQPRFKIVLSDGQAPIADEAPKVLRDFAARVDQIVQGLRALVTT